jgi:outer membrane lipoprotein-sorting protein
VKHQGDGSTLEWLLGCRGLLQILFFLVITSLAVNSRAQNLVDPGPPESLDAHDLIAGVIDNTRGLSSYAEMTMTIHRPDWERSSSLQAWTRGREDALIRFTAPARDAGNATLKDHEKMWTYTPKLNRVIRLPFSLMSQGWAGSDFSYNDLSRTDALLHEYDLKLLDVNESDEQIVYTIEAIPHETAAVVWGKELIVFRSDNVLLEQVYFDQDMEPLKKLIGSDIQAMGGRVFATRMRMIKLNEPDNWTELNYTEAEFDIELDDGLFTVFSLKTGRTR